MASKMIYDVNENIVRVSHQDSDPNVAYFQTIEDVDPIIESAKLHREAVTRKDNFRHVARVPITIYEQAVREGWADDQDAWRRWLNAHENQPFRVWEGTV
jgi:hypothetical protein